jgi:Protein of unknown function (DUF992)
MNKIFAASLIAIAAATSTAEAAGGVKIGLLTCRVEGGAGFLIGSAKGIDCKYKPAGSGRAERYTGSIGKIGLDIGITNETVMAWVVFAPGKTKSGALKGSYNGLSAEATAGLGLGANILVGGFRQTINLQPISVQAQTGLNLSIAVTNLTLRYDR